WPGAGCRESDHRAGDPPGGCPQLLRTVESGLGELGPDGEQRPAVPLRGLVVVGVSRDRNLRDGPDVQPVRRYRWPSPQPALRAILKRGAPACRWPRFGTCTCPIAPAATGFTPSRARA